MNSLLQRAGGPAGLLRRFMSQPAQSLRLTWRIIRSTLVNKRLTVLEAPYRKPYFEAVLPKQQALAAAFEDLRDLKVRGHRVTAGEMVTRQGLHIWSLIREYKLHTVVETGVCNGLSSHIVLSALAEQGAGTLLSIDLPEFSDESGSEDVWQGKGGAVVPSKCAVGWLVDDALKDRWDLRLGASRDLLPACLAVNQPIDLFIHDSEHSFDNQLFEFRQAFGALRIGGYLVLSDIQWSSAYDVFWREVRSQARHYFLDHSCAVVQKLK